MLIIYDKKNTMISFFENCENINFQILYIYFFYLVGTFTHFFIN